MKSPTFYSDLTKTFTDLCKKKEYDLKCPTVEIKSTLTSPKATLQAKFESDDGKIVAELTDKFVDKHATVKLTLNTSKPPTLELENDTLVDGLKLAFKAEFNNSYKLTGKMKRDFAAITSEVTYSIGRSEITLSESLVLGFDPFSIGGSCAIDPSKDKPLTNFDVALQYKKNEICGTAKIVEKLKLLDLCFSYQLDGNTLFGAGWTYNPDNKKQSITAAGSYKFGACKVLAKASASDDSSLGSIVISQELAKDVRLSISSEFELLRFQKQAPKMGIKLVLGE